MSSETLKQFYEDKYADEKAATSIATIERTKAPVNRYEAVVKFFPQYFGGGDILELGAGSGSVANTFLKSDMDISSYTLGDISMSRLENLKDNLGDERVRVFEVDAEDLPEDVEGEYDAVIMVALIEHLIDPMGALANMRKLLKPGGIVYIDTPNVLKYTRRIKAMAGRFPSTSSVNEGFTTYTGEPTSLHDEGHLHYFTFRSLSMMLTERCGFSKTDRFGYACGRLTPFGKGFDNRLASLWPTMFSEIAMIAHA